MATIPNPSAQLPGGAVRSTFRRDVWMTGLAIVLSCLFAALIYHLFLVPPKINLKDAPQADVVTLIYTDAYWFHQLWMRWMVVDWVLTFLATGTAVVAVIKNSYSVKSQATNLSFLDHFLIVLAVLAVLANTFDGKLHAGPLSQQYRDGDLILQRAEIEYAASAKDADARAALVRRWSEAQAKLEAAPVLAKPNDASEKPAEPAGFSH